MIAIENEQMNENKFLALLRGIKVGGHNIIKMANLKECFENMGFTRVKTYIQSNNYHTKLEHNYKIACSTGNK